MSSKGDSLADIVQASYLQLSSVASDLNTVSDEFGKSVAEIDSALKKLNLGISVWVVVTEWQDDQGFDFHNQEIGYAKVEGKWGISIRTVSGNRNWPDQDSVEQWSFNDGPRQLRLAAIEKLPELLTTLSKEAIVTTEKIKRKLAETQAVAAAVKAAAWGPAEPARRTIRRIGEAQKK
jgi:hypothetical protein